MKGGTVVVGIDPGANGGLCKMVGGSVHSTRPMPSTSDIRQVMEFIMCEPRADVVLIEDVHSRSGEGVKSTWTFGFNTGIVTGAAICACDRVEKVSTKDWRAAAGLSPRSDKKERKKDVADWVMSTYPHVPVIVTSRSKVPHSGVCDAIAIAHYWFKENENGNV